MKATLNKSAILLTILVLIVLICGFLLPEKLVIPVQGASKADWNSKSFWFRPWGKSGVHKGIDIFAKEGTPVIAACPGLVVSAESIPDGGNVISVLGPKWRIHYYAHLQSISVHAGEYVAAGKPLGTVGTTGNAVGKPPHLHYSIISQIPYLWRYKLESYGVDRMFFLDPGEILGNS